MGGGIAGSSLAVQLARADGAPHDQRGLHSRAGRLLERAAEKDETSIVEIAHRIIQQHRGSSG
ncbi:MAG: hypothetical protein Q8K58_01400 [Acidimicrobiales bacterium]|nr:hypothetical protein [Acidimicrobiales bacterium]